MCEVQMLRALVELRLAAAAEEIFGLFERTIAEYKEELFCSKEENQRQRELLDAVSPQPRLHRADVEQLSVVKEEVLPEQQKCSFSVDQQEQEPPPHIKEELWCSQEGEQLQGLEEADVTKFPFTPVPVKSEDDEEEAQSSQLQQRQTQHMEREADGEDYEGPEPARSSHPHLQPEAEDLTEDFSDPETDDSADWRETRDPQSALNSLKHDSGRKKPFSCSECGNTFGSKSNLNTHMRTHTGERPFSCSECGNTFRNKSHMKRHMKTHTGEKRFSSRVCDMRFTRRSGVKTHKCVGPMEREADGEDCGGPEPARSSHPHLQPEAEDLTEDSSDAETDDSADWRETRDPQSALNSLKHDSGCKKPFSCSECGKTFSNKSHLKTHMRTHTGERPFSCSECGHTFRNKSDLKRHMKTHTGEKPFSCSVCMKSFRQSGNLQSHMTVHTGEKRFSCRVCNMRFTRRSGVKIHKCVGPMEREADGEDCGGPEPARSSHPHLQPEAEDLTEDSSDAETDDSADWRETRDPQSALNSLKHDSGRKKPFSCSECGKTFSNKSHLKTHMRTHTAEKPFSCSECGHTFRNKSHMKRHMRTHTGERPFSCSECGKTFSRKSHLKTHMRTHTAEKPFSCSECAHTFRNKSHMKRHMRTHTGEKPFSCSVCMKSFRQSGSLQLHMTVHTGEKRFSCRVCNMRFTRRSGVKIHKCVGRMEREADGEDCGGPEPARSSHSRLQPKTEDQTGDSSDAETDDSAHWRETRDPQSANIIQDVRNHSAEPSVATHLASSHT